MRISKRSMLAKEKFADSNMSIANSIAKATFIGVLVFPLTVVISAIAFGNDPFILTKLPTWEHIIIFGILYWLPLIVTQYGRKKAMDIYDQVEKSTIKKNYKIARAQRSRPK